MRIMIKISRTSGFNPKKSRTRRPCRRMTVGKYRRRIYLPEHRRWGADPPLVFVDHFFNTRITHTNFLTLITKTLTLGKRIQVDFVGKSRAAVEATAPRGQSTWSRNGRKDAQLTAGMVVMKASDFTGKRSVDRMRHETIGKQGFIGGRCTADQRCHCGTFLKFQKNSAERWETNPTSANSLEMIFGKVGIAVRSTHNTLHMLTNERAKMRRDDMK